MSKKAVSQPINFRDKKSRFQKVYLQDYKPFFRGKMLSKKACIKTMSFYIIMCQAISQVIPPDKHHLLTILPLRSVFNYYPNMFLGIPGDIVSHFLTRGKWIEKNKRILVTLNTCILQRTWIIYCCPGHAACFGCFADFCFA